VARVDQPARAPRALGEDEVRRLLRAARRTGSPRDRALRAAPRDGGAAGRAAKLDVDDVPTTERTGAEHVRAGKRERPRTVPLPADARSRLRRWLTERARHPAARRGNPALWLGRRGRLSARQLQLIVAELGADARLVDVSRAHPAAHRGDPPVTRTVLHQRNVDQPINGSNRYTPARTTGSTLSPTI